MERIYGIVEKVNKDIAYVSVKRDSMCSDNCASCGLCSMKKTTLTVKNPIGAKPNDKVYVELKEGGLLAAFLVYGGPVLIILLGVIISSYLSYDEGLTALSILGGVVLWYIIVKICEIKGFTDNKYGAQIVSIDSLEGDKN